MTSLAQVIKFIQTECKIVVARGWGKEGMAI